MEEFVTHEIAKKLKEKGFKEKCVAHYFGDEFNYNISQFRGVCLGDFMMSFNTLCKTDNLYPSYHKCADAPAISQVLKWLRKEKHTYIYVDVCKEGWFFEVKCLRSFYMINTDFFDKHESYEQAALGGIEYVIDNLI